MWKWIERTKSMKGDLLNFKDEPLSGLSVLLLIILDIFIFTNVMIGVEAETAKVPRFSNYYPSDCSRHFSEVQTDYKDFSHYRYAQSRASHLRPHLSEYCKELDEKIEVFSLTEPFKSRLKRIYEVENQQQKNTQRLKEISKQYNTRLFERIAQMPNNRALKDAKNEYEALLLDNKRLEQELTAISPVATQDGFEAYAQYVRKNGAAFEKQKEAYKFWQPFKAYAHMLIFILPLLVFFGFFYQRSKRRELMHQEYNPIVKIIAAHISLILALPLFWYSLTLIYHVLPKTLLKKIVDYLVEIGLISLLNYISILLVVLFFGGLIYWIQKRRLKHKHAVVLSKNYKKLVSWSQCFGCEYKIDYTKMYCPFCGVKLHEKCSSCENEIVVHEEYCSECGARHQKKSSTETTPG